MPPDGRLAHAVRGDGRSRRTQERRLFLPPHVGLDLVPLLGAPEPLERFGRFAFPPAQRQAAGCFLDVESGDEKSEQNGSEDHGQSSPVEIGA